MSARECIGCLYDQPMDGDAHHLEDWGGGNAYRVVCTRGPIERELRALKYEVGWSMALSTPAVRLIEETAFDMRMRGYCDIGFEDFISEAIEAAAEMGL
jgi:predicted dithiol-disulfide oxidoreductase (DUF899 family)